jgi:cytochrome c556
MKRLLVILAAAGLFGVMPAFAAEYSEGSMEPSEHVQQCAIQAETIQQKIKRLDAEIAKGEKKYDVKTLKDLKVKLDEANKMLDQLNKP